MHILLIGFSRYEPSAGKGDFPATVTVWSSSEIPKNEVIPPEVAKVKQVFFDDLLSGPVKGSVSRMFGHKAIATLSITDLERRLKKLYQRDEVNCLIGFFKPAVQMRVTCPIAEKLLGMRSIPHGTNAVRIAVRNH